MIVFRVRVSRRRKEDCRPRDNAIVAAGLQRSPAPNPSRKMTDGTDETRAGTAAKKDGREGKQ